MVRLGHVSLEALKSGNCIWQLYTGADAFVPLKDLSLAFFFSPPLSISLCTIYTNLGGEGIMHGIKQTKVDTIITSLELLPKLTPLLEEVSRPEQVLELVFR